MNNIPEVPFDVWFGSINYNGLTKKVNIDSTHFKDIKLRKSETDYSGMNPDHARLFMGFMRLLAIEFSQTDEYLWPEGIKRDLSNIVFIEDENGNITLDFILDAEFAPGEILSNLGDLNLIVSINIGHTHPPLNDEGAVLMSLICTDVFQKALNEIGIMRVSANEENDIFVVPFVDDPNHQLFKVCINAFAYDLNVDNLNTYAIADQLNAALPNLIRNDMLTCIRGKYKHTENDKSSVFVGLEIAGLKLLISIAAENINFTDESNE